VMSSEALLENPALFSGEVKDLDDLALEYLEICRGGRLKEELKMVKPHLFKFLYSGLREHQDIRVLVGSARNIEEQIRVVEMLRDRRKDIPKEDKFG
jgi:tRNA-dihydrouridine synthase 1